MLSGNVAPKKNLKVYTSRYSNPELKGNKYYTVGISLGNPRWKLGYTVNKKLRELAPPQTMWGDTEETFNKRYEEMLDEWGAPAIQSLIDRLLVDADKKDIVFLCFEDIRVEGQYCHRSVLGAWLTAYLGIEVEELPDPSKPKGMVKIEPKQESILL